MSLPKASSHCGIVLHPAGHTRSPAMHRAAYQALAIDASYEVFDIRPSELAKAVSSFRDLGLRQFAVSIPHKETMLHLVDEIEPVAQAIGAINTVTRIEDQLIGTNTDWIGALRALEREGPIENLRAVVLGAGGTARALVYGLCQRGCEVIVLNRTRERADALASNLGAASAGALGDLAGLKPDIVVNTTSVGLNEMISPVPADALPEGAIALDAVYAPEQTQFLKDAAIRGARTIGGKWMLVYQAIEQLRLWTARTDSPLAEADLESASDIMADAFDQAGRTNHASST